MPDESPYSDDVLKLVAQIEAASSSEEKCNLMLALAVRFFGDHDQADSGITDEYHEYFEEYQRRRLEFQQSALRLARLALTEVRGRVKRGEFEMPQPKTSTVN